MLDVIVDLLADAELEVADSLHAGSPVLVVTTLATATSCAVLLETAPILLLISSLDRLELSDQNLVHFLATLKGFQSWSIYLLHVLQGVERNSGLAPAMTILFIAI